jgi:hypothetical protein
MSDLTSWPIVDLNKQADRLHENLLRGQVAGRSLVDEDESYDEFGNPVGRDAGRLDR